MWKKLIRISALFSALCLVGHVSASEYGCEVLMCMSNPQGPMAVQQCVPPVQRFLDEQARKPAKPFPTCEEGAPATMVPARRNYDACPSGTQALGDSLRATQLSPAIFASMQRSNPTGLRLPTDTQAPAVNQLPASIQTGIGDGERRMATSAQNKICVGNKLGDLAINFGTPDQPDVQQISIYEQLSTIAPASSPRVIDVYISNQLYRSVRY